MDLKTISVPILFFIIILQSAAFADGWHPSDYQLHMQEPNQKAIISWDGQTETMILSSSVRSYDMANIAWVIPIQSSTKPEVIEGNITVFEDLVRYFKEPVESYGGREQARSGGVEILETKEIDIYNITILRAASSDDLIDWLNENRYMVPDEAEPIITKYVDKGDFYFIANKIDLTNRFSDTIGFLDDFRTGKITKQTIGSTKERLSYNLVYYDIQETQEALTRAILSGEDYDSVLGRHWPFLLFISEERYENLIEQYGANGDAFTKMYTLNSWYFGRDELPVLYCKYEDDDDEPETIFIHKDSVRSTSVRCDIVESIFGSVENAKNMYSQYYIDLKQDYQILYDLLGEEIESEYNQISTETRSDLSEYNNYLDMLRVGMATPLKFEFQPKEPYYPLEISSLNRGETLIEVYIITENPVGDSNDILTVEKSKKINSELRGKLEKHLDIGSAEYVTRLSYRGNLESLSDDAEFDEESIDSSLVDETMPEETEYKEQTGYAKQYTLLESIWNWIVNLFR